jgi:hypothetical protein
LLLKEQYEYAVVAYDCCRGLLESNGHRGTQSDFTVSSSNAHEVGIESRASAGKAKLGAIRKFIATSKFRNSLKKRRSASLNRVKNLSLPIVDVRDAKDQQAVEELRRELLARDLLPPQHDDYHVLLRSVPDDSFLGISIRIIFKCKFRLTERFGLKDSQVMRTRRNVPEIDVIGLVGEGIRYE